MSFSKNVIFCGLLVFFWLFALMLPTNMLCLGSVSALSDKEKINSVEFVECLFPNATTEQASALKAKYGFSGTDLGIPVYDSQRQRTLIFFGDTFENIDHNSTTNSFPNGSWTWRSNIMAVSTDTNLSDGLQFSGFYTGGKITNLVDGNLPANSQVKAVIEGKHRSITAGGMEVTKIPTGGIEINGTIYMFYFSKASWDFRADSMNYGGCVKSTDGGATWTKVNQLSWANHSTGTNSEYYELDDNNQIVKGNTAANIQTLMNENINNISSNAGIDITKHTCHFFTQIYPVDGKDGYVYLLGEGGYRTMGIKLARVKKENFEDFDSYQYFTGLNASNEPQWSTGVSGLNALDSKTNSCGFIVGSASKDDPNSGCGEHSCFYNEYLGKWIITYLQGNWVPSTNGTGIKYRLADNIWGPYSDSKTVFFGYSKAGLLAKDSNGGNVSAIYGGFILPQWVENNGQTMYTIISQYRSTSTPILYTSNLVKVTFNTEAEATADSYSVKFDNNGGSGTMANQSFSVGASQKLTKNAFTKTGYIFKNWNTAADGSGTSYTDEQSVTNLVANGTVTLYAQWTANGYEVKFDNNGGSGTMANQSFSVGASQKLTKNAFTKTGYNFKNWNTAADGSGTTYTDEQSVTNLTETTGGVVTLYAIWTAKSSSSSSSDLGDKIEESLDDLGDQVSSWWDDVKNWFSDRWDDVKNWVEDLPEWSYYVAGGVGGLIIVLILWAIFSPKKRRLNSDENKNDSNKK